MRLSVIVATKNRAYAIAGCLDSIAAAITHAAPVDAEIVVVDNGSTDDTGAIIKAWASESAVPVQLLFEPKSGLSCAHNRALRTARGDLLAFTDDDCRLSEDYISQLLRYDAADTGLVLRGGRIELGDPTDLPLTINTSPTRQQWSRAANSARHDNIGHSLAGCNMTMRRALVERVGSFDEGFGSGARIGSGGDTDYFIRAYLADVTLEYVPDMTVFHYHGRKTNDAGQKLLRNYMTGNGALYARYLFKDPNLCRPFYWDCKQALKEIITGKNTFLPDIGVSHRDKVVSSVRGAARYIFLHKNEKPLPDTRFPSPMRREAPSPKMKLLFITGQKYLPQVYGGTQLSTHQLCRSLLRRGHEVAVLGSFMHGGLFAWKAKMQRRLLLRTLSRDTHMGYPVWRSWFPSNEVAYVSKREKPDLIIVVSGNTIRMAEAAKQTQIPIIIDFHDVAFDEGPFDALGNVPCIANSHFTADRCRSTYGVNSIVIAPFIEKESYRTETTRENVTFINPIPLKGRDVALEIARLCPDIPFSFVEAWPLSAELRQELMQKVSTLPNVKLLPLQKDMREVYGKCKILLVPSLYEEAYGRVVTEAQVSGIPVVASTRGGLPEAVGTGGILLDSDGSVHAWVTAIRKLWQDNQHYAELSAAALAHATRPTISGDYQINTWERALLAAALPSPAKRAAIEAECKRVFSGAFDTSRFRDAVIRETRDY